ncbi:MAG: hypothetical protein ACOCUT_00240 [bacterium]
METRMDLTNNKWLEDNTIKASSEGRKVLILSHMDCPIKRFDKKRVSYQIELRYLSIDPTKNGDELCCVKNNEFSFWSRRELTELGVFNDHTSLFDCFDIS